MVKEFKFKQSGKEIKIEGKSYFINVADPLVIGALTGVASKYSSIKNFDIENLDTLEEELTETLKDLVGTIDIVLGKGSAAEIYKGRTADFENVVELLQFITEVAFEDAKDKKNKYSIEGLKK